jgi:lipopolysaccharide biosynthesis glycosyltransferase
VLVSALDDAYAMPTAVMLYSVLKNSSDPDRFQIYLVDGGVSNLSKRRIEELVCHLGAKVIWVPPPQDLSAHLPTGDYYTLSTYYRLYLPHLLPSSIPKAIYLDSDLVVEGDLSELWNADVSDYYLLAARDAEGFSTSSLPHLASCPGATILSDSEYFNAGVLVVNLAKWRRDKISDALVLFANAWPEHLKFADQDALNVIIQEGRGILDPKWNQAIPTWAPMANTALVPGGIVHYVGASKPWLGSAIYRSASLFDEYLQGCGWLAHDEWIAYKLKKHVSGAMHRLAYYVGRAGKSVRRLKRRVTARGKSMLAASGLVS